MLLSLPLSNSAASLIPFISIKTVISERYERSVRTLFADTRLHLLNSKILFPSNLDGLLIFGLLSITFTMFLILLVLETSKIVFLITFFLISTFTILVLFTSVFTIFSWVALNFLETPYIVIRDGIFSLIHPPNIFRNVVVQVQYQDTWGM